MSIYVDEEKGICKINWLFEVSLDFYKKNKEYVEKINEAVERVEYKKNLDWYTPSYFWDRLDWKTKLAMWLLKDKLGKWNCSNFGDIETTYIPADSCSYYVASCSYYVAECVGWEIGRGYFLMLDKKISTKDKVKKLEKEIEELEKEIEKK